MKSNKEFSDLIRNDLLTLENYVERYYPIKMIKTIQKLFKPIFPPPSMTDIDVQVEDMTDELYKKLQDEIK